MGDWLAVQRRTGQTRPMRFEGMNGEIGGPRWWARALSFAAVIGLLMGVIGPFGSYLNPMPLRVLDQFVMTISGTILAGVLIPLLLRVGARLGLPLAFSLAVAIAITAIPIAALSALVSMLIWPWSVAHYRVSNWYFEALLLLSVFVVLWIMLEAALGAWNGGSPAAAPAVGAVVALQTEDNYVRVHRAQGSSLELTPLHEAITKYGQASGAQVHRGWWVAASAVEGAERIGRNWRLRLANGLRAPVARNRVAEVRARGWMPGP
jgi:hypothetical protein